MLDDPMTNTLTAVYVVETPPHGAVWRVCCQRDQVAAVKPRQAVASVYRLDDGLSGAKPGPEGGGGQVEGPTAP